MAGRASQITIEVLREGASARASQLGIEVLREGATARASQLTIEVLRAGGQARCSQFVLEILVPNLEANVLPIYPVLPGLAFVVTWTPQFAEMPSQVTSTLANIDLSLADSPVHEFGLTYDFLRDGVLQNTGSSEFKTMFGFFLRMNGQPGRFYFKNPDDYTVTAQPIGTTDGSTNVFVISRTFGVGDNSGTEDVGGIDETADFNLYLDAVLVDPADYDLVTTIPGLMRVQFHSTPTTGQALTVDCNYYYYCKFTETTSFEKFLDRIWDARAVKIRSCRAGA